MRWELYRYRLQGEFELNLKRETLVIIIRAQDTSVHNNLCTVSIKAGGIIRDVCAMQNGHRRYSRKRADTHLDGRQRDPCTIKYTNVRSLDEINLSLAAKELGHFIFSSSSYRYCLINDYREAYLLTMAFGHVAIFIQTNIARRRIPVLWVTFFLCQIF